MRGTEPAVASVKTDASAIDSDSLLPPIEQVNLAIQSLQVGDNGMARKRLNWALQKKPNLRTAKRLLKQLDADPIQYLGSEYFPYRTQPGDSLSVLAAHYLNDSLKFVILARYNGIDDPSQLKVGQLLKIPGTPPTAEGPDDISETIGETTDLDAGGPDESLAADPSPNPGNQVNSEAEELPEPLSARVINEDTGTPALSTPAGDTSTAKIQVSAPNHSDDTYLSAQKLYRAGRYPEGASLLEGELKDAQQASSLHNLLLRDLLVRIYEAYSEQLVERGEIRLAKTVLEKALAIDPQNEKAIGQLLRLEERIGNQ